MLCSVLLTRVLISLDLPLHGTWSFYSLVFIFGGPFYGGSYCEFVVAFSVNATLQAGTASPSCPRDKTCLVGRSFCVMPPSWPYSIPGLLTTNHNCQFRSYINPKETEILLILCNTDNFLDVKYMLCLILYVFFSSCVEVYIHRNIRTPNFKILRPPLLG